MSIQLIHGSAHSIPIPDKSVQVICTSPPYWNLRKYSGGSGIEWPTIFYSPMPGLPPLRVQGCEPGCEHEWGYVKRHWDNRHAAAVAQGLESKGQTGGKVNPDRSTNDSYCLHCSGWRGELGLEPDPTMYIAHLILCLHEWRRCLRDDGCAFINLGDSYANTGNPGQDFSASKVGYGGKGRGHLGGQPKKPMPTGLKPKDLCGIPWRFAFAAQAEGWYLRSAITWCKSAAMPESVRDRPTKATEQIFLLTKNERYFYDSEAIHERFADARMGNPGNYTNGYSDGAGRNDGETKAQAWTKGLDGNVSGRNMRDWQIINPEPFVGGHFAVFPSRIPEIAILAGSSAYGCCAACGAAYARVVEDTPEYAAIKSSQNWKENRGETLLTGNEYGRSKRESATRNTITTGWQPRCECFGHFEMVEPEKKYDEEGDETYASQIAEPYKVYVPHGEQPEPERCTILDPFHGSGTSQKVAMRLGRSYIGVDTSQEYLDDITAQRLGDGVQMEIGYG